jgi:hypothetical protein
MDNDNYVKLELKGMTIHISENFLEQNPELRSVTDGKEFIKKVPNFYKYCHRDDGPAVYNNRPDYNHLYIIKGRILIPPHQAPKGYDEINNKEEIEELLHKIKYKENVKKVLCE